MSLDTPSRRVLRYDLAVTFDLNSSRYLGEIAMAPLSLALGDSLEIENASVIGLLHFATSMAAVRENYLQSGTTFAAIHLISAGLLNARHHLLLLKPSYAEAGTLEGMRSLSVFAKNETDLFAFGYQRLILSPGVGVAVHLGGFTASIGYSRTFTFDDDGVEAGSWLYLHVGLDGRGLGIP